jgi:hypothetical protein
MCRWSHSAETSFSGMSLGKEEFVAYPPYLHEAVKLERRLLRVKRMGGEHG